MWLPPPLPPWWQPTKASTSWCHLCPESSWACHPTPQMRNLRELPPKWGLPNGCQSPLCLGMDVSVASLTVLVRCQFSLYLRWPSQTGKQANAVHLLSNQCHAQPLRHLYLAAWGHGQHTVAQLLSGMHPARTAHSWLWAPPAHDQRARGTMELAQEPLSSGSHGGMETSPAVQSFSGQIALPVLLWRSVAWQRGPILLQQRHPP